MGLLAMMGLSPRSQEPRKAGLTTWVQKTIMTLHAACPA
jgi:hypothetical protein